MANYLIGPGVRDALAANNDEPRSDEAYFHNADGSAAYSITQGRDAIYRWTPEDGVKKLPIA